MRLNSVGGTGATTWRAWSAASLALLLALAAVRCGGSGGGDGGIVDPQPADISGTWDIRENQADPPRTASCTTPGTSFRFVFYLEAQVTQNGHAFSGSCQPEYAGYVFSTSGTVSANVVAGTLTRSNGADTDRIAYSGTVSGDRITIRPTRYTQDWNPGFSCTCTGEWVATRR